MAPSLVQSTVVAGLLSSLLSSTTTTIAYDGSSNILEPHGRTRTPSSSQRGGLGDPPPSSSFGRRRRRGGKAEIVDTILPEFRSDRDGDGDGDGGIFVAETFRASFGAGNFDGGAEDDEEELQVALRFPNDDGGGGGAASPSGPSVHRRRSDLSSILRPDRSSSYLSSGTDGRLDGIVPVPPSCYRRTGTTIAGVVCDSGRTVVIGADTRATDGTVVADKRCSKIHELASNVWACGAGTSGDIDALVRRARFVFLLRGTVESTIGNNKGGGEGRWRAPPARVAAVFTYLRDALYKGNGNIGANLVLGGYDHASSRAMLAGIHPHGSIDCIPFTALGSGGLAATAVLENGYGGVDMSVEDAKVLVVRAIRAGITNDLGSGSQVDLCIIGSDGAIHRRAAVEEEGLPPVPSEGGDDDEVEADPSATAITRSGVNGFGSLPYAVKSKRIVAEPEAFVLQRKNDWLDKVLNLDA